MTTLADPTCSAAAVDGVESDLALLNRFIDAGDADAFAQIVRRYSNVVYAASMRILGDKGGAQDVAQETFYRLMSDPQSVQRSLAGWLHRSATNLALDARRSEKSRRIREITYGQQRPETGPGESTWSQVSPMVDEALAELPDADRQLIVRHFLQGMQQADLAAELNLSAATISRRIKAALNQLLLKLNARGVRMGAAALALFLAERAARRASGAFVVEMAKMQLIASLKSPVIAPPVPPMTYTRPYATASKKYATLTRGQTIAIHAGSLAVLGAMVAMLAISWARANPKPVERFTSPVMVEHEDK